MADFKPNIYPIIYWGLAYGLAAAILLVLISFLANLIGYFSFVVFLAGLVWGGYRNYKKQKATFEAGAGVTSGPQSPVQEFKQAVGDIAEASQEIFQQETEATATETAVEGEQPTALAQQDIAVEEPPAPEAPSEPEQPQAPPQNPTNIPPAV